MLALLAGVRADVDDAAPAALDHAGKGRFRHVEAAAEVDAHHIVPVVEAHPREGAVAGDAGIIHHDVDRSDLFGHPRAAVEAGLMVADVPFIGADAGAVGERSEERRDGKGWVGKWRYRW